MSSLSRLAITVALVAGFGSLAQAQSRWVQPSADGFYGVAEGRSAYVDSTSPRISPVPASESDTVMGLRVPR